MARELIIPFLITANYQTSLAIRQLRGELSQLPAELTALRAAAAEVYAIGAMGLFSMGMLAAGAQQLASSLVAAQRMAALAAIASGQFAGASAVASQILSESAKIASQSSVSLNEVTAAYLEAARAGLSLGEASALLPEAINLAVTSGGELSEVFRMTFAIMRNMGIPITKQTARSLTSELSYALDKSLMDIEDVMHAIKYVGPIAGQLQIPFHDLAAALMLLHDAGIRASIAGTGLARLLIRLEAPTAQARKRLAELGIDFHQIRPSMHNLADIIDLLSSNVDELTIRMLLGERAERAFYAIVQQGTYRLRQYAAELKSLGESGDYAQRKMSAFAQTPAQRLATALNQIRTFAVMITEPIVKLQLTITETFAKVVSASPILGMLAKMAVGFTGLFGTIMLLGASISWLAGRFLELGTIWHHLLLVIDRLQASVRLLTMSALKTPFLGLWEGFKALVLPFGGGLERLATWISERLRMSELVSAISQPLVFWRRARRVPPLLQPLPEFLSLQFGSMAAAAAKLGMPIEQFLMAGAAFGPVRPTRISLEIDWSRFVKQTYARLFESVNREMALELGKEITRASGQQVSDALAYALGATVIQAVRGIISRISVSGGFAKWQGKIFDEIRRMALQGQLVDETFLQTLGFASFEKFSDAIVASLSVADKRLKEAVKSKFMRLPEVAAAVAMSREAKEAVDALIGRFQHIPASMLDEVLKEFSIGLSNTISSLDKPIFPFLRDYQRKVAAVLRHAGVPTFARSILMGVASLPADAVAEAFQTSLGVMTGLAVGRLPMSAKRLSRLISDLATEFAAYLSDVPNVFEASIRLGLAFASVMPKFPSLTVVKSLINQISRRLSVLQNLRVLGLATADQFAEITNLQEQLGLLVGVYTSAKIQPLFQRALKAAQRMKPTPAMLRYNIPTLTNIIKNFTDKQFASLRAALLQLGYDLPEVISRILREGAPFIAQLRQQFASLGQVGVEAFAQFRTLARSVFLTRMQLGREFTTKAFVQMRQTLSSLGVPPEMVEEISKALEVGLMLFIAEQAAASTKAKATRQTLEEGAQTLKAKVSSFWKDFAVAAKFVGRVLLTILRLPFDLFMFYLVNTVVFFVQDIPDIMRQYRIGQRLRSIASKTAQGFVSVIKPVATWFGSILRSLLEVPILLIAGSLRFSFRVLWTALSALGRWIYSMIDPRFIAWLKSLPQRILSHVTAVIRFIAGVGRAFMLVLQGIVGVAWLLVDVFLTPIMRFAYQFVRTIVSAVANFVTRIAGTLKQLASTAFAWLQVRALALWRNIVIGARIAAFFGMAVYSIVQILAEMAMEKIRDIGQRILSAIAPRIAALRNFLANIWNRVATWFSDVFARISTAIVQKLGPVFARIASAASFVYREFIKSFAPFWSAFRKFFATLTAPLRSLFGFITNLFSQINLSQLGQAILQALNKPLRDILSSIARSSFVVPISALGRLALSLHKTISASIQLVFAQLGKSKVVEVSKPLLALLPQFAAALDIKRFLGGGRLGKAIGFLGRATIAALIASFIVDMIPWQEIGQALHLRPKTISTLASLGSRIRDWIGAGILTIVAGLKLAIWDPITHIIGIFRGDGKSLIQRFRETISSFGAAIKSVFEQTTREQEALRWQLEITGKSVLITLADAFRNFADNLVAGWQSIVALERKTARNLSELERLAGMTGQIGPAPIGVGNEIAEIGKIAVTYANALSELQDLKERFRTLQTIKAATFTPANQLVTAARTLYSDLQKVLQIPMEELENLPAAGNLAAIQPESLPKESFEALNSLVMFTSYLANKQSGFEALLEQIRTQILSLPPEKRAELSGTINWLNQAISQIQLASTFLERYIASSPAERAALRDQFRSTIQELASVISPEQVNAYLIDPLRRSYEELGNAIAEQLQKLQEIVDPIKLREIAKSIAQAQWDFITELHRLRSEVGSAVAGFLEELGALEDAADQYGTAADELANAYFKVVDILQRPSANWQQALTDLAEAFEAAGVEGDRFRVKIAELQRLMSQYNYLGLTKEAALETKKRLAELGTEILKLYERRRQALENAAAQELSFAETAVEYGLVLPSFTENAIAMEFKLIEALNREAEIRRQLLELQGVPSEKAAEIASRTVLKGLLQLKLIHKATLEELKSWYRESADIFSKYGNRLYEFYNRQVQAALAWRQAWAFHAMAMQLYSRLGGLLRGAPAKAVDWFNKFLASISEAAESSADIRVLVFGIGSLWSELKDLVPSGKDLQSLREAVQVLPTVLQVGVARISDLLSQASRLPAFGWEAFLTRLRIKREIDEIREMLFASTEELAGQIERWTNTLAEFVEEGFIPSIFAATLPEVRTTLINNLLWLRAFFVQQLQSLTFLQQFVPFGSKVWVELNEQILSTVDSLTQVERKLRDIRSELLSLELYAIPERVGEFLVTQGPALQAFMRTGALGGQSTIQFTIYVNAQDVSVGVQQALAEAQRRLMGFNLQPLF